ncbi:MAG: hypothetical protein ACPGR6_06030, partial [Candidatus Puniceispirillaceae bacterium]
LALNMYPIWKTAFMAGRNPASRWSPISPDKSRALRLMHLHNLAPAFPIPLIAQLFFNSAEEFFLIACDIHQGKTKYLPNF